MFVTEIRVVLDRLLAPASEGMSEPVFGGVLDGVLAIGVGHFVSQTRAVKPLHIRTVTSASHRSAGARGLKATREIAFLQFIGC